MYNFIIFIMLVLGSVIIFTPMYLCDLKLDMKIMLVIQYVLYVALMIDGYIIGRVVDKRFKK